MINPDAGFSRGDLMRRIAELEASVRGLQTANRLRSASIGEGGLRLHDGGRITIDEGGAVQLIGGPLDIFRDGRIVMTNEDNNILVFIGADAITGKQVVQLRRENGEIILITQGSQQFGRDFWSMWDNSGNIIVSDDAETGWGLANPRLAPSLYPHFATVPASIGITTSPTFVPLWQGEWRVTNPWIQIGAVFTWQSTETSGEMRVRINDVTAYESGVITNTVLNTGRLDATSGGTARVGDTVNVFVDARLDSGAGEIKCVPVGMYAR